MSGATPWWMVGEATNAGGIRLLWALHKYFGRLPFQACAYVAVFYYWATRGEARRASMQYLSRMQRAHGVLGANRDSTGELAAELHWRHGLRHFKAFADTLLDKLLLASDRTSHAHVRFVGREALELMLARGSGAVFVTAHAGCLEMARTAALRHAGVKLNVLVHTAHAERFNRLLDRMGLASSVELIQVTQITAATAVLLAAKVARGEFVAIAGDRVPVGGGQTVQARFLGHDAAFPIGPYVLAMLLGCPLYLLLCLRDKHGYAVTFECLAERVELERGADGRRTQALAEFASLYANRLETLLLNSPYEWFNFFSFWDQTGTSTDRTEARDR